MFNGSLGTCLKGRTCLASTPPRWGHVFCLRPHLLLSLIHGRTWGRTAGPAPAARQLLPARGPRGAGSVRPSVCMAGPQFRQAGSGRERRRVESGRETRLSLGGGWEGIPLPCTPPVQVPYKPSPHQAHLSWICRSRCCWATISRRCRCTWPVSTHRMWLCLSAWACGDETETSAGAASPPPIPPSFPAPSPPCVCVTQQVGPQLPWL